MAGKQMTDNTQDDLPIKDDFVKVWESLRKVVASSHEHADQLATLSAGLEALDGKLAYQQKLLDHQTSNTENLDQGFASLKSELSSLREAVIGRNEDRGLISLVIEEIRTNIVNLEEGLRAELASLHSIYEASTQSEIPTQQMISDLNHRVAALTNRSSKLEAEYEDMRAAIEGFRAQPAKRGGIFGGLFVRR